MKIHKQRLKSEYKNQSTVKKSTPTATKRTFSDREIDTVTDLRI